MAPIACLLLGVLSLFPPPAEDAIVVAPNGNDKSGTGAPANPYATLGRALPRARAGDTVLLRGGVYPATRVNVTLNGTAAAPVAIRAFPREVPILDGAGATFGTWDSVLNLNRCSHVVVEGLEIRNSPGRGITLHECVNVAVRGCSVHDVQNRAIGGSGDQLLIENNRVWNACLMNADNGQLRKGIKGMWPAAVATWRRESGGPSTNVTFRGNEVRECWGEGIDGFFLDGGAIEGNTVRDCYSVLIYCDTARNVRIDRNTLWITTDRFNRSDGNRPATGILLSMEHYESGPDISIESLVISNNIIMGTSSGISHWRDPRNTKPSNTYRNLTVAHNIVAETAGAVMRFDAVPAGTPAPSGCAAKNNIFFKGGISLGNPQGWTFSSNCWPDGVPAAAKDSASFAADPLFVRPVRGGPPEGYRLTASSPCLGRGTGLPEVAADFWGTPRRKTNPTIGIHEPGAR